MYKINEHIEILISRNEGTFDRAADQAYEQACLMFGLNEYGYFDNIEVCNRSIDIILVEFKSYRHTGSMAGQKHIYTFDGWVERNEG